MEFFLYTPPKWVKSIKLLENDHSSLSSELHNIDKACAWLMVGSCILLLLQEMFVPTRERKFVFSVV